MTPFIADPDFALYVGDVRTVLRELPDETMHSCITSPPYWGLRDYGAAGQLGLEPTPEEYVATLVEVFREVRRLLRPDGTLWLNLGDSYAGKSSGGWGDSHSTLRSGRLYDGDRARQAVRVAGSRHKVVDGLKGKDLVGIPWRLAFALQADGWYLRSDIIWAKPNPMPESVTDRPTKAHEYVFLLSRSARYFYDAGAVREPYLGDGRVGWPEGWGHEGGHTALEHSRLGRGPDGRRKTTVRGGDGSAQHRNGERWPDPAGRNKRTVWTIPTESYPDAHFATFPQALVEPCILAGCPVDGTVLDPFMGSGTTALVARRLGRRSVGVELNLEYAQMAAKRLAQLSLLAEETA